MNRVISYAFTLFLGALLPNSGYAIDAPPPVCEIVQVTHPLITIQARAQRGNRIIPVSFAYEGAVYRGQITLRLTEEEPIFRMDPPPAGIVYEEIRVSTSKETPPIVRGAQCVEVVWRK